MNIKSLRHKLGAILAVALLVLSSVFVASSPTLAATIDVKMGSDSGQLVFEPSDITASPGDTINFVVNQMAPHNIVFESDSVKASSDQLMFAPGETSSVTVPDAPGSYTFYCTPHRGAGMVGKLTIK